MRIKGILAYLGQRQRLPLWGLALALLVGWLVLHRLASLTGGLSSSEMRASTEAVGWHGIYNNPFYLPLKLVRSVIFLSFPDHGQLLTRLPNVIFGVLGIITFGWLVRLWHGVRTAILATVLFACSAWVLHVSRLASFDVLYLWAIPTLLLPPLLQKKYPNHPFFWYASLISWGLLLYVPGLVWLIIVNLWLQRKLIASGWKQFKLQWQRGLYFLVGLIWLPLLIINLMRPGNLLTWLGWPKHIGTLTEVLRRIAEVPAHLFFRGPVSPELWLARAPILDIFALVVCALGIYFYVRHWRAIRSRLLGSLLLVGIILVGLGGPVSLSLLIPLLYLAVATGLAYLLHEWFVVFPNNPLARGLGLGLIIAVVGLSCLYNTRAYFVAWPHTAATRSTFHYHRQP